MTTTIDALDSTVQKTNLLLRELAAALGWNDRRPQAYALLRAVLHTLRDRLPANEAVNFADELPLLVRGMYFEGWKPSQVPQKMDRNEFMEEVRRQFRFSTEQATPELIAITFRCLASHMDPRIFADIREELPEDVAGLIPTRLKSE